MPRLHFAAAVIALACQATATAAPSIIIVRAKVFTADPALPQAEAVAIEAGKFSAVGRTDDILPLAAPTTRVIDAGGRLVVPGLVEAHVHLGAGFPLFAQPAEHLALPGLPFPGPTPEQALAAVQKAATAPGDWITAFIGVGVARDRRNWRAALDAVAPDRPVMLRAFWGHTTLLNSAALTRLGIDDAVKDPIGGWWGRDSNGRLDGRAHETAENMGWERAAPPDPVRLAGAFNTAAQQYARWGVTSIHLINNGKSLELTRDALRLLPAGQKWTVYAWGAASPGITQVTQAWAAMDAARRDLPPRMRIEGPKWMLDGTPLEQNALQRNAYDGRPGWHGRSNLSDAQLQELLQGALRRPDQLMLHVVGDAETDRLLAAMEKLAPPSAWADRRVRLEHGDGIRPDTVARVARLGLVVTQNPTHLPPPLPSGAPPRPAATMAMLKGLLQAGVPLALGSDARGDEANPFFNMMLASTYTASAGQALSREEALAAYTRGGAFAERQEHGKGRVRVGMAADLALLSQDVLTVAAPALPATRSLLTLVDGDVVFEEVGW
jgi:predicted amidohydrolase YtcJ